MGQWAVRWLTGPLLEAYERQKTKNPAHSQGKSSVPRENCSLGGRQASQELPCPPVVEGWLVAHQ